MLRFRMLVGVAVAMAGAAPALASNCGGSTEVLTLTDWAAEPPTGIMAGTSVAAMRVTLRNSGDKALRMIDASLFFEDVLGNSVGLGAVLDPDVAIEPGGEVVQEFNALGWDRLLKVAREDVVATVCLEAAVFGDGSKAEF